MKKILIVDDARFMQKATSAMLSPKYETVCASSGEEALALYEKERPDMVLTDLLMPGMTGLELQKVLQERYRDPAPIMFMTADENEENESRGLAGGAMDYIRKPFKQELLLRRVDNIMRQVSRIAGLKTVAETDHMTGLLNKANAQKTLTELCLHATGTLMMIDLDSFKLVNDIYGHGMGDQVLIRFSEIIKNVIRASDVAGRMGGDEFIVFCKDIRDEAIIAERARQINERIYEAAKALMGEDFHIPLGASVGAVCVPDEGTDFAALYQKADKALYRVKQHGKHGYAVYRSGDAAEEDETKGVATSIEGIRMILDERNRQKGAYALSVERFTTVYRYAVRTLENYHGSLTLALFSLRAAAGAPEEELAERFGEKLGQTLRRSDAYAKNGKNQFIALLTDADEEKRDIVLRRVRETWAAEDAAGQLEASCETMVISI